MTAAASQTISKLFNNALSGNDSFILMMLSKHSHVIVRECWCCFLRNDVKLIIKEKPERPRPLKQVIFFCVCMCAKKNIYIISRLNLNEHIKIIKKSMSRPLWRTYRNLNHVSLRDKVTLVFFQTLTELVPIHFHCTEKCSVNIAPSISCRVANKKK